MLYWVAATFEPTKKEKEDEGKQEELLVEPKIIVAKNDKVAAMKLMTTEDSLKDKDLDRVQVHVSPF